MEKIKQLHTKIVLSKTVLVEGEVSGLRATMKLYESNSSDITDSSLGPRKTQENVSSVARY